jgi:hypothetical protein
MHQAPKPLMLIVDLDGEQPTEWCSGPDATGACPRATNGQLVPCAGKQLIALDSDLSPMHSRMVWAREAECPLPVMVAGGG